LINCSQLTAPYQKIKELDGKQLYYSFLSGAQRIFENQKHLNKINVFPVSDADTGTNLASTMRSIMDAIIPTDNFKQTAGAIADAALTGARGNSGIIFAQFLYGFSTEIEAQHTIDIKSFAVSMQKAVNYAYEAIANPVEGTILTVIKDWANYLYALKDIIDDFIRLLYEAYEIAKKSLGETTKRLEVLARSHVVDAGAKGFVVFLEGFLEFFTRGYAHVQKPEHVVIEEEAETVEDLHEVITYRYCTEAMLSGTNLDRQQLHDALVNSGDSLVIAGSSQKMRIHIHTDFPSELMSTLHRFGNITYQKVDDMVMQHEVRFNRKSKVALVTDSTCDLPKEFIDRYQIHVVPLAIHFGDRLFLDRLTIQPRQFYSFMDRFDALPTSSQPSYKDFQNKYEFLCTLYDSVIALNLPQVMSGTFSNSSKAARDVTQSTGKKISVFDSKTLSGGLALILIRAARAIEEGMKEEMLLSRIEEWIKKAGLKVSVDTLKYIVRTGRVSKFKSFLARFLDLKPVIELSENGKAELRAKSLTEMGSMRKIIRSMEKVASENRIWEYTITHAAGEKTAEWYRKEMVRITGKEPLFIDHASPALVANTGPGIVAIAYLLE
jgi:uncharacterized protein